MDSPNTCRSSQNGLQLKLRCPKNSGEKHDTGQARSGLEWERSSNGTRNYRHRRARESDLRPIVRLSVCEHVRRSHTILFHLFIVLLLLRTRPKMCLKIVPLAIWYSQPHVILHVPTILYPGFPLPQRVLSLPLERVLGHLRNS